MTAVAVITGTTHGIGRVTALELARAGCTVLMLCRDETGAERVREQIVRQVAGAAIHCVRCDLASLTSVRECARILRQQYPPLNLLINNAGIVSSRHRMSVDGFELTFATNHLGPFLLTRLLLERLASPARIINVASRVHQRAQLQLDRVADPRARYGAVAAYAQSKLANVLFTFALARRLAGSSVTVNCLHPGVVATHLLPGWLRLLKPLLSPVMFDPERGAATTLHLALSPDVAGVSGRYFDEHAQPQPASPLAQQSQLQELLWAASERWTAASAQDPPLLVPSAA